MMRRVGVILITLALTGFLLGGCATQQEAATETQEEQTEKKQAEEVQGKEPEKTQETTGTTQETAAGPEEEPEFVTVRIQFMADSAVLLEQERRKLLAHGAVLEQYPDLMLLIKGHAARFGTEESSQSLSEQRARAVADYILQQGGVDESQLTVVGVGSREPEADNATPSGRARNRRVEISVLDY